MTSYFFYGLFMDRALLQSNGFHPSPAIQAKFPDHNLIIGRRATLVPQPGCITYGMLMELPVGESDAMYASEDLKDYQPQIIETVRLSDEVTQQALCYLLPHSKIESALDGVYARNLSELLLDLGFPPDYAARILTP